MRAVTLLQLLTLGTTPEEHGGLYAKPGTQVYQNVQAFMKIYDA